MSNRAVPRVVLMTILIGALAGCAGGGGGASAAATSGASAAATTAKATAKPDAGDPTPGTALSACEIVSADDIKAATKVASVAAGTLKASPTVLSPGRTLCTYQGDFGRIQVELVPEDGANLYAAARKSYKDAVEIPGLGDGAFTSAQNNRAFIWKGAVTVMLTTVLNVGFDKAALSKTLGETIVSKL
jgi:hypothetical protein